MRHRAKPIWWIAVGLVVALARCIDTPVERQRICEATSGRCFYVANTSAHGSGSFTDPYGLPGEGPNSAGIKLYQVRHAVIEDDYIHDNTAGIFDKESAVANVYRRNLLTANLQPFYGNNQADPASYELYDNVIDGEIGLHYLTDGAVIHDNLLRRDTLAGDWAGATWNSELWNNVVIGPGGQVLAYYDSHDSLSTTPPAQLAYMDYNVYGAVPSYRFGAYSSGPEQVLSQADMIIHGYELHRAIALVSDIFVDRVSYQLKPPWQTAGRYGDPVGPENVAEILNVGRYGPGAK